MIVCLCLHIYNIINLPEMEQEHTQLSILYNIKLVVNFVDNPSLT